MIDLDREQRATDQRLIALCEGHTEPDLDAYVEMIRPDDEDTIWRS